MPRHKWTNHKVADWGPRRMAHPKIPPTTKPYVALWRRPTEDIDGNPVYKWTAYLVPRDDYTAEERRFATKMEAEQFIEVMIIKERRELGLAETDDGERDIKKGTK